MSQLDYKEESIDGVTYRVHMLPARRAQRMLVRLSKVAGPAFASLMDGDPDQEIDAGAFGRSISALLICADESVVDVILSELAEVTTADGKALQPIYDLHFAGRMGALFRWAAFALRSQYADFFIALASALEGVEGLSEKAKGFRFPKASTGLSGASS